MTTDATRDGKHWKRVEELFHQVLLEPAPERARFLDSACRGDEHLRRDVESLLATLEKDAPALEGRAIDVAARIAARSPHPSLIGQTLNSYQVLSLIGKGGMGEVYLARDQRLERQVAIKVLPEALAEDPERLARFEREAKLLASLNHPNIASIHGLEDAEGKRFLVLELVEGQTLAERLHKGPLALEEALEVCRQIAEGLEAAHEKGVVHRDLKPGNVMITADDRIKILDFGLAKALAGESQAADATHSPTITDAMTHPGVILGTAAYMSPEQVRGKPVDKRSDIWAFGCVLFESLTGKRAFGGETVTETLAVILTNEPDWQALPSTTPWKVKDLLQRCLQKNPKERLRDIGDARIEMGESFGQPAEIISVVPRLASRWLLALASLVLILGVLIGAGLIWNFRPIAPSSPVRSVIKVESAHWLAGILYEYQWPTRTAIAISKNGRFIVYSAVRENPAPQVKSQLYLRRTDQLEAMPISGTEGGISPFLSPDDLWVGFWADGKLMKVSVDGGVPVPLCDCGASFGASWGPDNSIVFSPKRDSGLSRIPADGGKPEVLTTPDKTKQEWCHRLPHWLPDGRGALFTIMGAITDLQPRVALLDLRTRKWTVILEDAADACYVPTGHLVFLRQGTLMVVPFDLDRLVVSGQPVPAIASVMQALNIADPNFGTAAGQFSVSGSGWLIYAVGGIMPDHEDSLVWVDQKGNAQPVVSFKGAFFAPRLSPDGQRITYATIARECHVYVYDLHRDAVSRLTSEGTSVLTSWTPDGKRVAFSWFKSGEPNLYWQPADGSQPMERLTTSDHYQAPGAFSPDGTTLSFVEWSQDTGWDIHLLDLRSRRITPFLNSGPFEAWPEFSPDGRWIAYGSSESGRDEIYVRPFPGPGGKWQISNEGGWQPRWSRNGNQLFYRWGDKMWVVDVQTDGSFSPGKARLLFEVPGFRETGPVPCWDISLDGKRFLMVKIEERKPRPVTEMILVQNWLEELKRLVPVK